ncbi:MAG: PDZ domain-containing protein [Gemmatimonadaceae bacterium]
MHSKLFLALGVAAAATWAGPSQSQERTRVFQSEPGRAFAYSLGFEGDEDRAVIGITTGSSGSARDTLGVLISSVTTGGPAEKAGLEEGNRIAAINGVNLRLASADVGDWDMASAMRRRLTRELGKVKAGADVELRVYGSGQTRTVRVKTVTYDSLYPNTRRTVSRRFDDEDRAALGIGLGSSGSKRDTLGVLVSWLDDDGPAAKAGIEEGNRIAAVGSVDLRVSRDDAGDEMISSVKSMRLQRELEKLKPGDEVELRVYSDGRTRTVKVKTVAASTLSRGTRGFMTTPRAMVAPMPAIPPVPPMPARIMRITL